MRGGSFRRNFEIKTLGVYPLDARSVSNILDRAAMRKNNMVFHRLPNGAYGLLAWYPDAKPVKEEDDKESDEKEAVAAKKTTTASKKLRKPRAASKAKRGSKKPPERKEEPHAAHGPDISGPEPDAKAA
jgi:hypothetical protein